MDIDTKNLLTISSGLIAFFASSAFGVQIFIKKLKVNLATWGAVVILDLVGLIMVIMENNKQPYMQIGWLFAACIIFAAALKNRGGWKWTDVETYSMSICTIAVIIWVSTDSVFWPLFGYILACFASILPQAKQYWLNSAEGKETTWIWLLTCFVILLSIAGSPHLGPQYSVVYFGLLLLNGGMAWITLRKSQ